MILWDLPEPVCREVQVQEVLSARDEHRNNQEITCIVKPKDHLLLTVTVYFLCLSLGDELNPL